MSYIYILKCADGLYYIGATNNLEKRLVHHQKGYSRYTKNKRPLKLVYQEKHVTKAAAFKKRKTNKILEKAKSC